MAEPGLFPREVDVSEHIRKQSADSELLDKVSKNVGSISANLKILEERYSTLRNKTQISEQSIIELEKEVRGDVKLISEDLMDIKHELNDVKEKLRLISGEIKNLVNKNEFKVMERYLDMWQPMNFVTRDALNKMLEERDG